MLVATRVSVCARGDPCGAIPNVMLKQTATTKMAVVYYVYQIASCLMRHVLVPALLADPRTTLVLFAYMIAYLR